MRDVLNEQKHTADERLAKLVELFFDEVGSHAFCGPILFGGKMTILGETKALDKMSHESVRSTVAKTASAFARWNTIEVSAHQCESRPA